VGDITGKTDNLIYTNSDKLITVTEDDLLFVLDGTPGHVGIGHSGAISSGIRKVNVLDDRTLSKGWLRYVLGSPNVQTTIKQHTKGITIFHASSALPYIQVPLPPLAEQERIVGLLDEADELRKLRAKSERYSESLIPAILHEMFGDPNENPNGWGVAELGALCSTMYRYPTFYGFEYVGHGVPVARIGNITDQGILDPDLSRYVFISPEVSSKFPRTILEPFDIVMAVRGDGSTGKRIGLVTSNNLVGANISPNLLRFKTDSRVLNPLYLFHLMVSNQGQALIAKCITRTAKKTITARDIAAIVLPVPPIKRQCEFAERAKAVGELQSKQAGSHGRLDDLFQSMLNRAFSGEL
jgi:type I restriction enzyme S subunit